MQTNDWRDDLNRLAGFGLARTTAVPTLRFGVPVRIGVVMRKVPDASGHELPLAWYLLREEDQRLVAFSRVEQMPLLGDSWLADGSSYETDKEDLHPKDAIQILRSDFLDLAGAFFSRRELDRATRQRTGDALRSMISTRIRPWVYAASSDFWDWVDHDS